MSATGLEVFDKTLHITNTWLSEIMEKLGPDRQVAWHVLGAVLRTIRDRIPMELSAHLSAELPMLVRGLYFDQWRAAAPQERYRTQEEFFDRLVVNLGATRPVGASDAARAVFEVLNRHLDEGQARKIREALPEEVRLLWPQKVMEQQG
ncbi:DUF2267 domain-containing protein [Microvirga flavescens]|uniref:DUF2267 domain-containing protein n=1 Tax=Microvirga flavescens TaxID=2249811 RepID=UPI000DD6AA3C|nr:DUF2267 domain-containing protein [Microvirga flavescens]